MLNFDYEKYVKILEKLIVDLETVNDFQAQNVFSIFGPICTFLRIGKIESFLEKTERACIDFRNDVALYYEIEGFSKKRFYEIKTMTDNRDLVTYRFYQIKNDRKWTEDIIERITVIQKYLFIIQGRIHVIGALRKLCFVDDELGCNNQRDIMYKLNGYIEQKRICQFGIAMFNIKGLAAINQNIGRKNANEVLKILCQNLQTALGDETSVGRVQADNFLVLFKKEKIDVLTDFLSEQTVEVEGISVVIKACTAVYLIDDEEMTAVEIRDRVGIVMSFLKQDGENLKFFDNNLVKKQKADKEKIEYFPNAIKNEEFKVYYQPKVSLSDYSLRGAEALCRWYHDDKIIPPNDFIPVFERSNLICKLDFYMLDHVCSDIRHWIDEGKKPVCTSVNLSRRNMTDVDLVSRLTAIVDSYAIPHEYIEFELTETTTDVGFKDLHAIFDALHEAHFKVSVDDFGVGYSSLNLVRDFPWDVLKIDKCFLPTKDSRPIDYDMLKSVISLVQGFGVECIVEGVETVEQINLLAENGCYLVQGYYFSKPVGKEAFEQMLDKRLFPVKS